MKKKLIGISLSILIMISVLPMATIATSERQCSLNTLDDIDIKISAGAFIPPFLLRPTLFERHIGKNIQIVVSNHKNEDVGGMFKITMSGLLGQLCHEHNFTVDKGNTFRGYFVLSRLPIIATLKITVEVDGITKSREGISFGKLVFLA